METFERLWDFFVTNRNEIAQIAAYIIAGASLLIKIVPVLDKHNKILPIIKFIGKYIALNTTVTDADRK